MSMDETRPEVAAAVKLGHAPVWDPPASGTGVSRWTCSRCGAAVLSTRSNVYGSAVDKECKR